MISHTFKVVNVEGFLWIEIIYLFFNDLYKSMRAMCVWQNDEIEREIVVCDKE